MSDLKLIARVAASIHLAGSVTPLRPKIPSLLIAGRRYVLSTDGGDLGDLAEEPPDSDEGFGARIIRGPVTNKWKYLWAYNTDRQRITMWRATDGNEKLEDSSRSQAARIARLDRKGQLNRVTNEEYRKVEAYMRKLENDTLEALQRYLEENKGDVQKKVDETLKGLLDTLRPKLDAQLDALEKGVVPLGWHPPVGVHEQYVVRSKYTYVISRFLEREFSLQKCEDYLRSKGIDVDAPGVDIQAAQWARDDLIQAIYDQYLPERPQD